MQATAGLRLIGEEKSEKILEAVIIYLLISPSINTPILNLFIIMEIDVARQVRRLFINSSLLYERDWVAVISGTQEGTYMWVSGILYT